MENALLYRLNQRTATSRRNKNEKITDVQTLVAFRLLVGSSTLGFFFDVSGRQIPARGVVMTGILVIMTAVFILEIQKQDE